MKENKSIYISLISSILCTIYIFLILHYSSSFQYIFNNNFFFTFLLAVILTFIIFIIILRLQNINKSLTSIGLRNIFFISFIYFTCLLFLGSLSGINVKEQISVNENRRLAEFPRRLPFHEKFPEEFNAFIDDRIGFRAEARNLYGKISYFTFDDINTLQGLIVGEDDWLFAKAGTGYFQRLYSVNKDELENLKKIMEQFQKYCNEKQIKLYFLMPPHKETLYPEKYAKFIKRLNNLDAYDVIIDYIKDNININFIDIYDKLKKNKNIFQLYYKDDIHWNTLGGYIAYKELGRVIKKDFPDFKLISEDNVYKCSKDKEGYLALYTNGDIGRKLPRYKYIPPQMSELCISEPVKLTVFDHSMTDNDRRLYIETSYKNGLRIMIFHDSFIFAMRPFIYEASSEIWTALINAKAPLVRIPYAYIKEIEEFKPDLIIWESLEGTILNIMAGRILY